MDYADETTEIELIGNLLNDPDSVLDVMGTLTASDFTNGKLAKAYDHFIQAYRSGDKHDTGTLAKAADLDPVLLAKCLEDGWMTANIKFRARRIVEFSHRRTVLAECRKLAGELGQLNSHQMSERLSGIAAAISLKSGEKKVYDSTALCIRVTDMQEKRLADKGEIIGATLGLELLDKNVRGLKPKRTTVIAAGTGFGKTTLALNVFHNIAHDGKRILFLSNENDVDDNLDRLCGIATGHPLADVESGNVYDKIAFGFAKRFHGKAAFISDNSPRSIDEVCATISKYAVQESIDVAIVDYIGEISGEGKDKENEEARLARYGQRLVDCSKAMGVHIIILAQLNRAGNGKGKPTKADLAGCFKLAQKAHTMLLFWQDEEKTDVITIEKNRQGPAGVDVAVNYNRATQQIKESGLYIASTKEVVQPRGKTWRS